MQKIVTTIGIVALCTYFASLFFLIPDFFTFQTADGTGPVTNFLTGPATETARLVRDNFWFTCLHMLPYLIISEGLLLFAIHKFKEGNGRVAATFHENLRLEIFWTIIPILSVIFIVAPSFSLIDKINTAPGSDVEIKVTGQRFFFKYTYLENDITIADEALIVPAHKNITMSLTSVDVIHAWSVNSLGVKYDLVPGRTTQIWFNAEPGYYKGQCMELCGASHANMMITVKVVPEEEYNTWIAKKLKEKNAALSAMK